MFKRAPTDTLMGLEWAVRFYVSGFDDLKNQKGADDHVARYRNVVEATLKNIDQKMTALLKKDVRNLTNWAARMSTCIRKMHVLDKNLAFRGKSQWNWDEVINAMSFLEAVVKGATDTLELNGIEL